MKKIIMIIMISILQGVYCQKSMVTVKNNIPLQPAAVTENNNNAVEAELIEEKRNTEKEIDMKTVFEDILTSEDSTVMQRKYAQWLR